MGKWNKVNNKYYIRGFGYVGAITCCRCEKKVRRDKAVMTEVHGYNLCTKCHGKIVSYKSIKKLFQSVEVLYGV